MKITRRQFRELISEAMGFGRNVYQPTGNIEVIRKRDPEAPNAIGYEIGGVIRGLFPQDSLDFESDGTRAGSLDKVTLNLSTLRPKLTHRYIETGNTNLKVGQFKSRSKVTGDYVDVYDTVLSMMYEPWLAANNRQNERFLIFDLINSKLKELNYEPLPREAYQGLTINYLEQDVDLQDTGVSDPKAGQKMKPADVGQVRGGRTIGFKPNFN